jgi:DNA-binding protein HU-beta
LISLHGIGRLLSFIPGKQAAHNDVITWGCSHNNLISVIYFFCFLFLIVNQAFKFVPQNYCIRVVYIIKIRNKVTKAEVIAQIADQTGIDKADVQITVEAFFSVVKNSMATGENIYVRGFGSFVNKKESKKIARNISKNTAIVIDEHYVPSFKPSKVLSKK